MENREEQTEKVNDVVIPEDDEVLQEHLKKY